MSFFLIPKTKSDWFIFVIRLIIAAFFIYASIDKIINPEAFAKSIHNYRMTPPIFINLMAIFMPWLELVTGLALLIGWKYKGANLLILGMLAIFIVALASAWSRGLNINCGCFSTASTAKSDLLARLIEDAIMAVGCLIIMFENKLFRKNSKSLA